MSEKPAPPLDLAGETLARADTARHLAALANFGGGCLVFGFNDDMTSSGANPFSKVVYGRDFITGIVKRYLEPTFQCDVFSVRSALNVDHAVVIVPPHGAVPICTKASGPEINGKPKGIVQGTYYVRKPGPESAPVLTAAEWAPIIRRCVLHERASVLGAIDAALRGHERLASAGGDTLKIWHDAAHAAYLRDIVKYDAPTELAKHHLQVSYAIEQSDRAELEHNQLLSALREASNEVRDLVQSGFSLFYPFTDSAIAPRFTTDPSFQQGEVEFLECSQVRDTREPKFFPAYDMWRMSLDGKATHIREYWEDHRAPGVLFSPNIMAQLLAELVRHARAMAERFESATAVAFRCEWWGLAGREIGDPTTVWFPGRRAEDDHALAIGSWPIAALSSELPEIVAKLGGAVMRRFGDTSTVTPEWVRGQAPRWRSA